MSRRRTNLEGYDEALAKAELRICSHTELEAAKERTGAISENKSSKDKATKVTVPLLPLEDVIIFPHMVVPLFVGREKSINALEECVNKKLDLFLVAQRQATTVSPGEKDIFEVGTLGTILQILRLPDNTVKVLIEGKRRARIKSVPRNRSHDRSRSRGGRRRDPKASVEIEALVRSLKATFENYVKLNKRIPPEMLMSVNTIDDPSRLTDLIVAHLNLKLEDKQEILEIRIRPSVSRNFCSSCRARSRSFRSSAAFVLA